MLTLTKVLSRVTTVAASSAGATAVLETNQSTNEVQVPNQRTTVYTPHLHNNDEFIFVDHNNNNNNGTNSDSSLRSFVNSNMMMDNNISPLKIGVTGSEINCAFTTLNEHPDLIDDLMPPNLMSAEQTKKFRVAVTDLLNNPRVISSVKSKLLKYNLQSLSSGMIGNNDMNAHNLSYFDQDHVKGIDDDDDDDLTNSRSETSSTYAFNHYPTRGINHLSPSEQWNQLASDHPCAICQDVLAKPTILSCSHSFCGICLHDLMTSCSEVSSSSLHDIDELIYSMSVVKRCPTCNEEICRAGTYERTLDDAITVRASTIPSCEGKTNWMERKEAHKVPASRSKKLNTMMSSTDNGGDSDADGDDRGEEDTWASAWVIPALTVVIIVLIAIFRSK